ncbi:predicted protein [Plenodomus lingam JN3]|uniref:Predicted protein n=1 Tax=Leptosphaeria maculans (strain JN3 / isolate v23.1.3 / race Av1-4-5-6-7-8) TaxID=985895 RepID=E4ZQ39_LEPMJ|nr:predicted protein [Plenodomus lingam JN3]CBX89949.1 predicted protein [Plenodomus lingam JN3]
MVYSKMRGSLEVSTRVRCRSLELASLPPPSPFANDTSVSSV